MSSFNKGDTVRLQSGGPQMIILQSPNKILCGVLKGNAIESRTYCDPTQLILIKQVDGLVDLDEAIPTAHDKLDVSYPALAHL